ncbi:MAG: protein translocase subunit secG [Rickettsiales bacterium]|jgi:preprotein translocase subunit SecG|nr:protein translocase subunit secG [Rickettsiales bacterium]
METILLVIQLILVIAMVGAILLQPSSSDGLGGLGGGGGHGFMSSRATANMLTKTTAWLATAFIINSLALAWIFAHNKGAISPLLSAEPLSSTSAPQTPGTSEESPLAPAEKAPAAAPSVPLSE